MASILSLDQASSSSAVYATNTAELISPFPSIPRLTARLLLHHTSPPLAAPQSHRLSVFLQLRNQSVSLLDHVRVLLVLVVWPVRFDDLVDAVDGAGYAVRGDEFG